MILAIALTLIHVLIDWFYIEIEFEWWKIKKKKTRINHALHEGLFFSAVAIGTLIIQGWFFFAIAYGIKLLLFAPTLNLLRKEKWHYQSQEEGASTTDKIFRQLNKWTVLVIRIVGFLLGCLIFYWEAITENMLGSLSPLLG